MESSVAVHTSKACAQSENDYVLCNLCSYHCLDHAASFPDPISKFRRPTRIPACLAAQQTSAPLEAGRHLRPGRSGQPTNLVAFSYSVEDRQHV